MRALALAIALAALLAGCSAPASPDEAAVGLVLDLGADAAPGRYVAAAGLDEDGSLRLALLGVPGATLAMDDVLRVRNDGDAPREVALTATRVENARVLSYRFVAPGGALDLLDDAPSLALTLAPGEDARVGVELRLAEGAGADDARTTTRLSLVAR